MKARWHFQSSHLLCIFSWFCLKKQLDRRTSWRQSGLLQSEDEGAKTACWEENTAQKRGQQLHFFFFFFLRNAGPHRRAECVQQEVGLPLICVSEHMSAQPPLPWPEMGHPEKKRAARVRRRPVNLLPHLETLPRMERRADRWSPSFPARPGFCFFLGVGGRWGWTNSAHRLLFCFDQLAFP